MLTIAIDSGDAVLGVAACRDGSPVTTVEYDTSFRHTESLTPAIETVLQQTGWSPSDLDGILVTRGPGSFTGLRIGMATAKGIALATNAPVISVDSLEAMAMTEILLRSHRNQADFQDSLLVVPAVDARKSRLYTALFLGSISREGTLHPAIPRIERLTEDQDISADDTRRVIYRFLRDRPVSWVPVGAASRLIRDENPAEDHSRPALPSCMTSSMSAVIGVAYLGWERLRNQRIDDPYQGPFYLRTGEIGEPKRYPRFSDSGD